MNHLEQMLDESRTDYEALECLYKLGFRDQEIARELALASGRYRLMRCICEEEDCCGI